MAAIASTANSATGFVFSRTFDASREDVWNAFTQPEHLMHWWGTPGSSIEIARHELKPGGMFHYRMKFPDGRAMWARFIFREITAPERLITAAHKELSAKGAKVNQVEDDLYGPGSGVKWFNVEDPDRNQVFLVQA